MKLLKAIAIVLTGTVANAEDTRLTLGQTRQLAVVALEAGQLNDALTLSNALLTRNSEDVTGLLVKAQIGSRTGNHDAAIAWGQRAYWNAGDPASRYLAARVVAKAHADKGEFTRSQLWLRLASQSAPNEQAERSIATDYNFVRQLNPWSTTLSFGITPSSNINNGTFNDELNLFGFPFVPGADAQALSGYEISAGINTQYRVHSDANSATFLTFNASGRTYRLSSEARDEAPDVEGSDFAFASVSTGVTHRRALVPEWGLTTLRADVTQFWYGGDAYQRKLGLSVSQNFRLSDTDRITIGLNTQRTEALEEDDFDSVSQGINLSWAHQFADNGRVTTYAVYNDTQSDLPDDEFTSLRYGADYNFGQDFNGLLFSIGAEYEERNYDNSRFIGAPRDDESVTLRGSVVLTDIEYFGFQPVLNAEAKRSTSNVDLYDREYLSFGFDLRSSF